MKYMITQNAPIAEIIKETEALQEYQMSPAKLLDIKAAILCKPEKLPSALAISVLAAHKLNSALEIPSVAAA